MPALESQVAGILEYVGLEEPMLVREGRDWDVWTAGSQDPLGNTEEHTLLFLRSAASWNTVEEAMRELKLAGEGAPGSFAVVVRNSARVSSDLPRIAKITRARTVDTVRGFMAKALDRRLGRHVPPYGEVDTFVDPYLRVSDAAQPASAVETLVKWLCSDALEGPRVGVLVAPAALGKTTVARRVANELGRRRTSQRYPLLVTSDQWAALAMRSDLSVSEIWQVAMQRAYRATPTPEDVETAISNGLIVPIFDGFDELCTLLPGQFSPETVLLEMRDLLVEGRILMTARDVFWDEKIGANPPTPVQVIRLEPFDRELKMQYLDLRFPTDSEKSRKKEAVRLLQGLEQEERQIVRGPAEVPLSSVPLVVELVCECAASFDDERGLLNLGSIRTGESALDGVLLELLEREKVRQQLTVTGRDQFEMFKHIAGEVGRRFPVEELRLYAQVECRIAEDSKELDGLDQSALLSRDDGSRVFRFDFVHDHLQGLYLADQLESLGREKAQVHALLARHAGGASPVLDEAAKSLFRRGPERTTILLRELTAFVTRELPGPAQSGFLHLVLAFVRWGQPNLDRRGTADRLFEIVGDGRAITGLTIQGRLDRLGLQGKSFLRCVFKGASLGRCALDETTRFTGCRFLDPFEMVDCSGLSLVEIVEIAHMDSGALEVFQQAKGRGALPPTESQIKEAIRNNLLKFREGSLGFKSLKGNAKLRGRGGNSPLAPDVWEALLRFGVVSHEAREDVLVLPASAKAHVHRFLEHNIATGPVKVVLEELKRNLCIRS